MTNTAESMHRSRQDSRDIVGSLSKGMRVIEALAAAPSGLRLTDVAEATGQTRAGARRLLLTLVAAGYVHQEGRSFQLSAKLLSLVRSWLGGSTLWTFAEPVMLEVSQALGESCSAAVLEGEDVVYVARVAGQRIMSDSLAVGARLPAYCTSMGRVLLSDLDDTELARFFEEATICPNTPNTVMDRNALVRLVADVRRTGYAIVDEELELGLRSIAVPVRDRTGRIVAAINVSTQSARFSGEEMRQVILPHLQGAARKIENFLAVQ